jgi:hypothetical protein
MSNRILVRARNPGRRNGTLDRAVSHGAPTWKGMAATSASGDRRSVGTTPILVSGISGL